MVQAEGCFDFLSKFAAAAKAGIFLPSLDAAHPRSGFFSSPGQQTALDRYRDRCRSRVYVQFGVDAVQIGLGGAAGNPQVSADLLASFSRCDSGQHLLLALGQVDIVVPWWGETGAVRRAA